MSVATHHIGQMGARSVRGDAEAIFPLASGQLMKVKEDTAACRDRGLPVFAVYVRDAAARRGRRIGTLVYSLARANGCDSPACARGAHGPKTPAAGERVCHVVAVGQPAGDASARATLPRPIGGGAR